MDKFGHPCVFEDTVTFRGSVSGVARSSLSQDSLEYYPLDLERWRVWDAYGTTLPGTSASDDLGLYAGTFGTGCPYIGTGDVKASTVTRYARIFFQLPPEYVDGQRVQLRARGGMLTTVAGTSCTVDFECYKANGDTTKTGSDLVSTSAQSINSLTFGDKDFTVTATSLYAGDWLDIRVTIASVDAATGTAVIGALAEIGVLLDIQG